MKKYLLPALLSLMLFSCTQESQISVAPDITSHRFDPAGGTLDVVLFTNGSWTATCEDSSVSLTPESGDYTTPIHIAVGPNVERYTKSIRIDIVSRIDGKSANSRIVLTQDCFPFIFCEEPAATIGSAGGTVRFSVNSNSPWKVFVTTLDSEPFSLAVDPQSHGANRTEVSVLIPANETGIARTFAVTLVVEEDLSKFIVLKVSQEG